MWIKDLVRGWFLHTISGVLGRQRELHQEGDVEVEAERHWSDVATSQGVPSATRSWRSKEWVLSIDLPRSRFHLNCSWISGLPNCKGYIPVVLRLQAFGHLLPSPQEHNHGKHIRFLPILFQLELSAEWAREPFDMEGSGCLSSASQTAVGCSPSSSFLPLWHSQVASSQIVDSLDVSFIFFCFIG